MIDNDGRYLISVIKKLKHFEGTWENLYSNDENNSFVTCFSALLSEKKYFYWSEDTPLNQLDFVDQVIDKLIEVKFKPQNAYLIIFSKVADYLEHDFKEIISVEENEFRYKKYVCYYTDEELVDLKKHDNQLLSDNNIWSKGMSFDDTEKYKALLYRIIIKVPIIRLDF